MPTINRQILRLALPAILSNIALPLLGLCDTYITGHLGSPLYLAAIAVGTLMVNSTYWLFGFLRAGTSGLTAEAYGRNDLTLQRHILTLSLLIALAIGLAIILLSFPISSLLLLFADPPAGTALLARQYFLVSTISAPALLATMSITGWMIGKQNTLLPMLIAISVNILNILISFTLVYALRTGFIGVAYGTMTANWLGLILALILARRLQTGPLLSPLRSLRQGISIRRFFSVNTDLFFRSAAIMAITYGMTAFASRIGGEPALAANALLMQLFLFFSFFMDGFAYAAEALCGKYKGQQSLQTPPPSRFSRPLPLGSPLSQTIRLLTLWTAATTLIFSLTYYFGARPIAALLTDSPGVISTVTAMTPLCAAIPLCSGGAFLLDGIFIGLTRTRTMLTVTLTAAILFYAIALPISNPHFPVPSQAYHLLWTAFCLSLLTRTLLLALRLKTRP